MAIFEHPVLLILAVLLPAAVVVLLLVSHKSRLARLARMGSNNVVKRLIPTGAILPPGRRIIMLSAAAMLVGVAAAGPRWGRSESTISGAGIDIVLALDASFSMLATDERPSRLERMKQEVRRLRASSPGDRIGVIAFAGRSYILTPLTMDEGALDLFIDNLDPSVVGQAGSAISRAITQGMDLLLASQSASDRALIVMSDWESFDGEEEVLGAASRLRSAGISFVGVGFGTSAGSRIPMPPGVRPQFKLDESGAIVVSKYNPALLRLTAQEARGVAIESSDTDKAGRIRSALSSLRTQKRSVSAGSDFIPRFQLFLVPALVLLALDALLQDRLTRVPRGRSGATRRGLITSTAALLFIIAPAQPKPEQQSRAAKLLQSQRYAELAREYRRLIREGDSSEQTLYNLGTALLLADSLPAATGILDVPTSSDNEELRFRALFNRGLAQLLAAGTLGGEQRAEAMKIAQESYRDAILMRPDDLEAKWNYELAAGGGNLGSQAPTPADQQPRLEERGSYGGNLGREQAEQILNSAARDERDVMARSQERNQPFRPPGGKDW
jgi:Ca-activated chloride channel family protein